MAATVSFGRMWAGSICSIFPLWIESKALVMSTNNIVASSFFDKYTFKNSTDSQNVRGRGSISPEAKYVVNFGFYPVGHSISWPLWT